MTGTAYSKARKSSFISFFFNKKAQVIQPIPPPKINFLSLNFPDIWPELRQFIIKYDHTDIEQQNALENFAKESGMKVNGSITFNKTAMNIYTLLKSSIDAEERLIAKTVFQLSHIDNEGFISLTAGTEYSHFLQEQNTALDKILYKILEPSKELASKEDPNQLEKELNKLIKNILDDLLEELRSEVSSEYTLSLLPRQLEVLASSQTKNSEKDPPVMAHYTLKKRLEFRLLEKALENSMHMVTEEQKELEQAALQKEEKYKKMGYVSY